MTVSKEGDLSFVFETQYHVDQFLSTNEPLIKERLITGETILI